MKLKKLKQGGPIPKVSSPNSSSKIALESKESDRVNYYNPKRPKPTGDTVLNFLSDNDYLLNTPIIGNAIRYLAKEKAESSVNAAVGFEVKGNENISVEKYTGIDSKKNSLSLVSQYLNEDQSLSRTKYKPKSDYLEFLPSYSLKDKLGITKNPSNFINKDDIANIIKDKKTRFNTGDGASFYADRPDLGHYKTGLAYDEEKKLPYYFVSDAWDFEPNDYADKYSNEKEKDNAYQQAYLMHKAGKPFKIYDRFYIDPKTMKYVEDKKELGGLLDKKEMGGRFYNKYKKLLFGGEQEQDWKDRGFLKDKNSTGIDPSMALNTAAGAIDALDAGNDYGRQTVGTTTAKTALEGASAGFAIGGPIGAGIGLVGGAALGLINGSKAKSEEQRMIRAKDTSMKQLAASSTRAMQQSNPYMFTGNRVNMYKYGGKLKKLEMGGGEPSARAKRNNAKWSKVLGKDLSTVPAINEAQADQQRANTGAEFTRDWIKQREQRGDFGLKPSDALENNIENPTVYSTKQEYVDNTGNPIKRSLGLLKDKDYGNRTEGMYNPPLLFGNGKASINGELTPNKNIANASTHETTHQLQNELGANNLVLPANDAWKQSEDNINSELFRSNKPENKYLGSPKEIHARIMEGRATLGVQPGEIVTEDHLNKLKKVRPDTYKELNSVLDNEGIINSFNKTVLNDKPINTNITIGKMGGKIKKLAYGGGEKPKVPYNFDNGSSYSNSQFEEGVLGANKRVKSDATRIAKPLKPLLNNSPISTQYTLSKPAFIDNNFNTFSENSSENMGALSMQPEFQRQQLVDVNKPSTPTLPYGSNLPAPLLTRMNNYLKNEDYKQRDGGIRKLPNRTERDRPILPLNIPHQTTFSWGTNNTMMALGGSLKQLNSKDHLVVGRSHDEGGVKFPSKGVELEGGETKSGDFIFSKELGFAQKSLPLMVMKGVMEKVKGGSPLVKGINKHLTKLKYHQEATKAQMGLDNDLDDYIGKDTDNDEMALGGPIPPKKKAHFNNQKEYQDYLKASRYAGALPEVVANDLKPTGLKLNSGAKPLNPDRISSKEVSDNYRQASETAGFSEKEDNISSYLPFVSNAVNALRKYPSIPQPALATTQSIPLASFAAEKANLDNSVAKTNAKLTGLSSQQKQAVVGSVLANSVAGKNELAGLESRTNTDIKGRNATMSNQTALYNNQLQNKWLNDNTERSLAIIQNSQDNLSDSIDKHLEIKQNQIDQALDNKRIERLSKLFDKSVRDKSGVSINFDSKKAMGGKLKYKGGNR